MSDQYTLNFSVRFWFIYGTTEILNKIMWNCQSLLKFQQVFNWNWKEVKEFSFPFFKKAYKFSTHKVTNDDEKKFVFLMFQIIFSSNRV